ncbi:MAG: hypothetical protein QM754_10655 [Tepidisphaeraceae bacterium]
MPLDYKSRGKESNRQQYYTSVLGFAVAGVLTAFAATAVLVMMVVSSENADPMTIIIYGVCCLGIAAIANWKANWRGFFPGFLLGVGLFVLCPIAAIMIICGR